ncbi:Innexin unc-9 [Schistosoma japonicum]|nr:Innexin unc-9 [Schistosoma japonicum]
MALTPKCSLNLLNDSPNHSLTKSYTQIIHNNDWSSLYSTDHSVEPLNTLNPINASSTSSTSSCSTNHPCSIETQLYQEEEKILNQCLTIDNNNNNRLINDDLLLNDFYYDQDMLHNPYFYNSCHDFNCELTGGTTFDHSPILNRGYTRHTRKIDSDPTILLTLLKWARIGSSQLHGDDDQIDRINYQFTSVLLLILLTLTGFRQYLCKLYSLTVVIDI